MSYLVDKGYKVIFDKNVVTGQDMSHMMNKEAGTTRDSDANEMCGYWMHSSATAITVKFFTGEAKLAK